MSERMLSSTMTKLKGNMRHSPSRFNKHTISIRSFMGFSPPHLSTLKKPHCLQYFQRTYVYTFRVIVTLPCFIVVALTSVVPSSNHNCYQKSSRPGLIYLIPFKTAEDPNTIYEINKLNYNL